MSCCGPAKVATNGTVIIIIQSIRRLGVRRVCSTPSGQPLDRSTSMIIIIISPSARDETAEGKQPRAAYKGGLLCLLVHGCLHGWAHWRGWPDGVAGERWIRRTPNACLFTLLASYGGEGDGGGRQLQTSRPNPFAWTGRPPERVRLISGHLCLIPNIAIHMPSHPIPSHPIASNARRPGQTNSPAVV